MVVINGITTTWKRTIDALRLPVTVTTKEMPPRPKEEIIPFCYWASYGAGLDHIWVWRCVQLCCCWEMGWIVNGVQRPPPNPDQGGAKTPPPPATEGLPRRGPHAGHKGMGEAGIAGNTEHSRVSLRAPLSPEMASPDPKEEPLSPIQPRNLFGAEDTSDESSGTDVEESDVGPGAKVNISAEGCADNTYTYAGP